MSRKILAACSSLTGAATGAFLGTMLFRWLLTQGYYALVFPGAAMGLGCCLASLDRSWIRGGICGVAALAMGFFAEGYFRPFDEDKTFSFFLRNLGELSTVTFLMIAVGTLMGFWWGKDASPWRSRFSTKKSTQSGA